MKKLISKSLAISLALVAVFAQAEVIEVERIIDGVEYECLLDTQTQKILHCERD